MGLGLMQESYGLAYTVGEEPIFKMIEDFQRGIPTYRHPTRSKRYCCEESQKGGAAFLIPVSGLHIPLLGGVKGDSHSSSRHPQKSPSTALGTIEDALIRFVKTVHRGLFGAYLAQVYHTPDNVKFNTYHQPSYRLSSISREATGFDVC